MQPGPRHRPKYRGIERRLGPRICDPIPAKVRGTDAFGQEFEFNTILKDLGAGGLFFSTRRAIRKGDRLHLNIRLCEPESQASQFARVAALSVVIRTQRQSGGQVGIAAKFTEHRFL